MMRNCMGPVPKCGGRQKKTKRPTCSETDLLWWRSACREGCHGAILHCGKFDFLRKKAYIDSMIFYFKVRRMVP